MAEHKGDLRMQRQVAAIVNTDGVRVSWMSTESILSVMYALSLFLNISYATILKFLV